MNFVVFTFLKEFIILLLIFNNEFIAQQIHVNVFFVKCKMIRYVVVIFVFETAETVSNNIVDSWKIDELRAKFFYQQSPAHNVRGVVRFVR